MATGVLDGVKVVELAIHGFVPSCGAVLADWGADVVKIEAPQGDPLRHIMGAGLVADTGDFNFLWELFNRNKRGVAVDLRVDEGRAVFDRLLEDADVFLTNFLPTARAKLRVNPDDIWKVNPRIVYAKGHGQGQRGDDADLGGFDAVSYWARGGLGHVLTPPQGPMIMQRGAMGDAPSGAMLAGGVAAALYRREKTGKGIVVDVALLNMAVWQLGVDLTATTVTRQEPQGLHGTTALPNPLIGSYRTGDDRWLLLNMLDDTRHWEPTCRALGLDALIADPRFVDTAARSEHREELKTLIVDAIASRTLADLRAAVGAGHDLLRVGLATRGDRRPASPCQRIPCAASHARQRVSRPRRCSSTTTWWRSPGPHRRSASTPTRCSARSGTAPTTSRTCGK